MAGKGGYQKPAGPRPPSGVGKASTRTDGNVQPVKVPNVGSSPDLQYGDRQRLEQAQRIAPIPGATAIPPQPGTRQGVTGLPANNASLPPWLIDRASERPLEPVTAGLDMGAGPGSEALAFGQPPADVREAILLELYTTYGNEDALRDLQALRGERAATVELPTAPVATTPTAPTAPTAAPTAAPTGGPTMLPPL
jgi:hypothetical protein